MTELADGVVGGDRRALARAITLVESTKPDHRREAEQLLDALLARTGQALRVGLSGPPGAGKSTLIDVLGCRLVDDGHRVAVLAIDPTSSLSGGSILGDKTRMSELAQRREAFIRPSPSRGGVGGVARSTRSTVLLCEAAGYDVVIVETVGVGQLEAAVSDMVDTFVLLLPPGGGDELQGVKRGIMELADVVGITKADGDLATAAARAEADHRHAIHFLRRRHADWEVPVVAVSAVKGTGIDALWDAVVAHRRTLEADGSLARRRSEQALIAFDQGLRDRLIEEASADPDLRAVLEREHDAVASGRRSVPAAISAVIDRLKG